MHLEDIDFEEVAKLVKGNRLYLKDLVLNGEKPKMSVSQFYKFAATLVDLGILKGESASINNKEVMEGKTPKLEWFVEGLAAE